METILLTGGTGFIGSHTAVELLKEKYKVIIADNLSNSEASVVDRISRITGVKPLFYQVNVEDKAALDKIFCKHRIDAVIHFAGLKAVGESVKEPLKYYRNNLGTTLSLLEIMKNHSCDTLIFSSSATVYGENNPVPYKEDMAVGGCTSPYGRTKLMIEQILADEAKSNSNLSVILLRYFNPIGADESGIIGEKPDGVPNNLMPYITQTAMGIREKLYIYGNDYPTSDGTGVRDYIHVTDLARGHAAALKFGLKNKGTEVFNLGTGTGRSVLEVVRAFEKVNNLTVPYEIAPRRKGDIAAFYANADKANALLGWRAERTLEDMCQDAWRWQKNEVD